MLFVISPAKKLDTSEETRYTQQYSHPRMLDQAEILVKSLSRYSSKKIGKLMHLSEQLSELNYERYQTFSPPFTPENAKQAMLSFAGDVYQSLEVDVYDQQHFNYAQQHVRILSGLYGLLKPLDLIQPYRLEMGTKLKTRRGTDLYAFWKDRIRNLLEADLAETGDPTLVNLASNEYFKSVKAKDLQARIISPQFKDEKDGQFKMISFFAKQARGSMVDFAIKEQVNNVDQLKDFRGMGYQFREDLSTENEWLFVR